MIRPSRPGKTCRGSLRIRALFPWSPAISDALGRRQPYPLDADPRPDGVGFSVYSADATGIELLLFDAVDDPQPVRVVALDPAQHRTNHYWHCVVPGLGPGQVYAYRVRGPLAPERGLRFDPDKPLVSTNTVVARPRSGAARGVLQGP
jgi:isoamylase